ncbi:MAG: hypothetical protein C0610_16685 [Desulfobacteraceae bacterium]|nr:MAG: hypothetical protein C0610_16685 [Desulfobacteraceae bacterium]
MKFFEDIERKPLAKVGGSNKNEMAISYGLDAYDCALPQDWLNEWSRTLAKMKDMPRHEAYDMLMFGTVWCYDDGSLMGAPFFLYEELEVMMLDVVKIN